MTTFVEDFSTWDTGALITVPPESLEAADLMALVIELQNRLKVAECVAITAERLMKYL